MMKKAMSILLLLALAVSLCACGNSAAGGSAAAAPEGPKYVFLDENLGVESYAIGFRKGDDELAATVDSAVKALVKNGTYAEIGEKYPDIKDYLCLNPDDIDDSEIAEEGSGDSSFTFKHGFQSGNKHSVSMHILQRTFSRR